MSKIYVSKFSKFEIVFEWVVFCVVSWCNRVDFEIFAWIATFDQQVFCHRELLSEPFFSQVGTNERIENLLSESSWNGEFCLICVSIIKPFYISFCTDNWWRNSNVLQQLSLDRRFTTLWCEQFQWINVQYCRKTTQKTEKFECGAKETRARNYSK